MPNKPESELNTSSEAVALIADARGLPNPETNLLTYNERELIRLAYRMADCMEALAKERDTAVREAEAAEEELAAALENLNVQDSKIEDLKGIANAALGTKGE